MVLFVRGSTKTCLYLNAFCAGLAVSLRVSGRSLTLHTYASSMTVTKMNVSVLGTRRVEDVVTLWKARTRCAAQHGKDKVRDAQASVTRL
jgi:hypothetical protein